MKSQCFFTIQGISPNLDDIINSEDIGRNKVKTSTADKNQLGFDFKDGWE